MSDKINWINNSNDDFIPFIEIEEIGYNEKESISLQVKSEDKMVLSGPIMANRITEQMTLGTVQKTEQSLRLLIQAAQEIKQSFSQEAMLQNSSKIFLNEFCTIKFKGARRIGHTISALKVALEEFPEGNILFVTYSSDHVRTARNTLDNILENSLDIERIVFATHSSRTVNRPLNHTYSCVIVDLPFMMKKQEKEAITKISMKCLERDSNFLLIEVG